MERDNSVHTTAATTRLGRFVHAPLPLEGVRLLALDVVAQGGLVLLLQMRVELLPEALVSFCVWGGGIVVVSDVLVLHVSRHTHHTQPLPNRQNLKIKSHLCPRPRHQPFPHQLLDIRPRRRDGLAPRVPNACVGERVGEGGLVHLLECVGKEGAGGGG